MVFFIVAAISAAVGCIVALLAADPRRRVRLGPVATLLKPC